ncbi:hypothetical protein [Alloactinosynnema sp. L-07]|uniref:hypothetical protein n=1 Tax=Alloactinosynnema sp. L-07 TaxID=1653480 RepID=UPI00065EF66A|nr:hypothetical protein [Alloactinosynnema sp. L-07]CRK59077.1 hypothetical protein [Alloactinosynnema sp. L-07]
MYRGTLTPRRALALAERLPEGGAYWAHVAETTPHDPTVVDTSKPLPWMGWTYERFLLQSILDALNGANWQRGGGKGKQPPPGRRPQLKTPTGRDRMRRAARPPTSTSRRRGG